MMNGERDPQMWIEAFEHFRDRTAMGPIGASCTEITDDSLTIEFTMTDHARQPFGLLHGGVSLLVAETAASFHAAFRCDLTKVAPVGIDISGTHIGSTTDGTIRCVATVTRQATTFLFHDVTVSHVETGHTLCRARVTNFLKPH